MLAAGNLQLVEFGSYDGELTMSFAADALEMRILPEAHGVEKIAPTTTAQDALALMLRQGVHHLLVMQADTYLGIVSDRDLIQGAMRQGQLPAGLAAPVQTFLSRCVPPVRRESTLREIFEVMDAHHASAVPVAQGQTIFALITESDLLRFLRQMESEIVVEQPSELTTLTQVFLSNPLMQSAMNAVSSLGI
jgi:CBS domain-containing protein